MIDIVNKYISDTLKINPEIRDLENAILLPVPFFLRSVYSFYKAVIFDKEVVLVEKKSKEPLTASQFRKHIDILEKTFKKNVILVLDYMQSYNRYRLIEKSINFIIPGKQMYIPGLLIDLDDFSKNKQIKERTFFSTAAQVVLLYYLQHNKLQKMNIDSVYKNFGYSRMTVSRVFDEFVQRNICTEKSGKIRELEFAIAKREIWKVALPFLVNPVKKIVYMDSLPVSSNFFRTNIAALSEYSDIADNAGEQFAVSGKIFDSLVKDKMIIQYDAHEGRYYVELWKYNPGIISDNKTVDPLSLYLIFRESKDERIEYALELIINNMIW